MGEVQQRASMSTGGGKRVTGPTMAGKSIFFTILTNALNNVQEWPFLERFFVVE